MSATKPVTQRTGIPVARYYFFNGQTGKMSYKVGDSDLVDAPFPLRWLPLDIDASSISNSTNNGKNRKIWQVLP